jgi:glutathione synthase/RimK-type ligase-like ATP-grasp enzyme
LNQRQSLSIELEVAYDPSCRVGEPLRGELRLGEQRISLSEIQGVYVRLMDYQYLPEYRGRGEIGAKEDLATRSRISSLHERLVDWLEIAPQRVMNRLSAMGSNQSKPYQAQWIARAGFLIPPTLITNDPQLVKDFLHQHGRLIYKSISAERSVVAELKRGALSELGKIRHLPTQLQAYIPGENIRVHVAGEAVFACQIETPAVDYRYAEQNALEFRLQEVYIEREIEERCRALASLLGLPLCGIDLKRTPQGDYYCFEVNPSPAFSYYQELSGQDIAAAIVRYLAG